MRALILSACLTSLLMACSCPAPPPPRSASSGKDGGATAAEQEKLKAEVQAVIQSGAVSRVSGKADKPAMWVGPKWPTLDYDSKIKAAHLVALWVFMVPANGSLRDDEILFIFENRDGKVIGTYSKSGGLALD